VTRTFDGSALRRLPIESKRRHVERAEERALRSPRPRVASVWSDHSSLPPLAAWHTTLDARTVSRPSATDAVVPFAPDLRQEHHATDRRHGRGCARAPFRRQPAVTTGACGDSRDPIEDLLARIASTARAMAIAQRRAVFAGSGVASTSGRRMHRRCDPADSLGIGSVSHLRRIALDTEKRRVILSDENRTRCSCTRARPAGRRATPPSVQWVSARRRASATSRASR